MLALQYSRHIPAFALARAGRGRSSLVTGPLSMIHLGEVPEPELPGSRWQRVHPLLSGICGSDLAAIEGHVSLYMDPLTSYPFVPGHEVVGDLDDGTRVVVEPALGCAVRDLEPCPQCIEGRPGLCEKASEGVIGTGLQTGYCASTGGGWGEILVAHESQLHELPAALTDEAAVLVEPLACCIHAALRARPAPEETVLVYGAGLIGLLTVAAIRLLAPPRRLIAVAKHPAQREHALRLGADSVVSPDEVFQRVRFATGARRLEGMDRPLLLGGADTVFDCVGSAASLNDCVRLARARGRLVAVGMPGEERVDWAPIWQRELQVTGAYAYGMEPQAGGRRTFEIALEAAPGLHLELLSGPGFALGDYAAAIAYAQQAGRLGAARVVFDLRGLRA